MRCATNHSFENQCVMNLETAEMQQDHISAVEGQSTSSGEAPSWATRDDLQRPAHRPRSCYAVRCGNPTCLQWNFCIKPIGHGGRHWCGECDSFGGLDATDITQELSTNPEVTDQATLATQLYEVELPPTLEYPRMDSPLDHEHDHAGENANGLDPAPPAPPQDWTPESPRAVTCFECKESFHAPDWTRLGNQIVCCLCETRINQQVDEIEAHKRHEEEGEPCPVCNGVEPIICDTWSAIATP